MALPSKQATTARQEALTYLEDGRGVRFHEYRLLLPPRVADWRVGRYVDNPDATSFAHTIWKYNVCWWCGKDSREPLQLHHIFVTGRSDELCNFFMCDEECHNLIQASPKHLARVLYCKWAFDRIHTDWVRMALLRNKALPDPVKDL